MSSEMEGLVAQTRKVFGGASDFSGAFFIAFFGKFFRGIFSRALSRFRF